MVFRPIGERARWRILYDVLKTLDVGTVFTYVRMAEILQMDPVKDRHVLQMSVQRAGKESELEDKRAIEAVRGVGYRVVEPERHLVLARQHSRRAGRSLQRGLSKVVNVDLNGVDPNIRGAFDLLARGFQQQAHFNERMNRKVTDIGALVTEVSERTEEENKILKERMARLEQALGIKDGTAD
jgi:hypothetical protein